MAVGVVVGGSMAAGAIGCRRDGCVFLFYIQRFFFDPIGL